MAKIINGRKIRDEILAQLKKEIATLPFQPIFCDILVGNDTASAQYVRMKNKTAEKIGLEVLLAQFPVNITTEELLDKIKKLNQIDRLCGLIVQLPLPKNLDQAAILNAIDPSIDVDCIGLKNKELFYAGQPRFIFPTALAVFRIIETLGLELSKIKIAILGQGELVGRPLRQVFSSRGYIVETIDRKTPNTAQVLKEADLIISAAGQSGIIKGDMVKKDSVIIDAGTSESFGAILGDVDFDSVSKIASVLSPVPGGVGPVTIAMLFSNIVKAAKAKTSRDEVY